jgi:hypothetical protein
MTVATQESHQCLMVLHLVTSQLPSQADTPATRVWTDRRPAFHKAQQPGGLTCVIRTVGPHGSGRAGSHPRGSFQPKPPFSVLPGQA